MISIGFIGGLGPVELTVILLVFAVVGTAYLLVLMRDEPIEWHWVIGIALLFLMGVIPGLVGVWLYLSTQSDEDGTAGESSVISSTLLGIVLLVGSILVGSVVATVADELAGADAPGWVPIGVFLLGAVGTFVVASYLLYGR